MRHGNPRVRFLHGEINACSSASLSHDGSSIAVSPTSDIDTVRVSSTGSPPTKELSVVIGSSSITFCSFTTTYPVADSPPAICSGRRSPSVRHGGNLKTVLLQGHPRRDQRTLRLDAVTTAPRSLIHNHLPVNELGINNTVMQLAIHIILVEVRILTIRIRRCDSLTRGEFIRHCIRISTTHNCPVLAFCSNLSTHKASSQLFLRPEFCVEAVVLTVSTRELRTDRRRAVAVGGGQPPTRQRRHSPAGLLGRWLAVESVVRWPICGDGPTHREAVHAARRIILTNSLYGHHQRRRPLGGASPHTVVKVPPDVL